MSNRPRQLLIGVEKKFGHLAIGGLLRWIAGFKGLVFGLQLISPEMVEMLLFDQAAIYQGQVWRLFSYVLVPGTTSLLFIFFVVFFLWFISDALEQAWGEFRVSLYIIATIVCISAFGMIPGINGAINYMLTGQVFFSSVFLAFATIYPNQIINLMAVIPIKAKWLGLANLGMLIYTILRFSQASVLLGLLAAIAITAGLIPYLVVFAADFLRNLKQSSANASRRSAFQANAKEGTGDAFHTCAACGKTDTSDPDLEFRVAADEEEYCVGCLPSRNETEDNGPSPEAGSEA